MKVHLKYNLDKICRTVVQELLKKFDYRYTLTDSGCICFHDYVPADTYDQLQQELQRYGIDIIDNKKAILVQKVKATINNMIENGDIPLMKISAHLSSELDESYRTIAQIFSDVCHITIENFIILSKIERAKQLLTTESLSLTEISYRLNYSSVSHLSNQFKKITGLTPSTFQRLALRRRDFRTSMLN